MNAADMILGVENTFVTVGSELPSRYRVALHPKLRTYMRAHPGGGHIMGSSKLRLRHKCSPAIYDTSVGANSFSTEPVHMYLYAKDALDAYIAAQHVIEQEFLTYE